MKIGDLSNATGVEVGAIRFYERSGLIDLPDRLSNGYRSYGPRHLKHLCFVRHCRSLDMSIADIKKLLDFIALPDRNCSHLDELVDQQIDRVRARLTSLEVLEKSLVLLRSKCFPHRLIENCGSSGEPVLSASEKLPSDNSR